MVLAGAAFQCCLWKCLNVLWGLLGAYWHVQILIWTQLCLFFVLVYAAFNGWHILMGQVCISSNILPERCQQTMLDVVCPKPWNIYRERTIAGENPCRELFCLLFLCSVFIPPLQYMEIANGHMKLQKVTVVHCLFKFVYWQPSCFAKCSVHVFGQGNIFVNLLPLHCVHFMNLTCSYVFFVAFQMKLLALNVQPCVAFRAVLDTRVLFSL